MRIHLFCINLILVVLIAIHPLKTLAAEHLDDLLVDPTESSLIDNSAAKQKTIRIQKSKLKKEKKSKKPPKKQKEKQSDDESVIDENEASLILDSDYMDYYPEKNEVEATGNAKVVFPKENTTLYAGKIVFNHSENKIKAYDNVKLVSEHATTEGDFLNIDLNQGDGWMQNPVSIEKSIILSAQEAYIYSDRIEEINGVAKILKDQDIRLGATSFTNYVNPGRLNLEIPGIESLVKTEKESGVYKLKAKKIIIDPKKEHHIAKMENVDVYLRDIKIGSIPSIKIVSDKRQQFIETNIPEFGSTSGIGMYAGPGFVINLPGASTLKLVPFLNYSKDKFGAGGIARFRNAYNMTEVGYGSSQDRFIVRGRHEFNDDWRLRYSQNAFQDEWFMGHRRPSYSAALEFNKKYYIEDLNATFSQRFAGGLYSDWEKQLKDLEGRLKWMTQTQKTLYAYANKNEDFHMSLDAVAQTSIAAYTTGDTQGLVRVGPMLKTAFKNWTQHLIYYQAGTAGESPFGFDRYRYGKSNFVFIESLRINKYLTIGYLGSIVLNKEYSNDNTFQENRFLISLGPRHARVTLGYDAFRQNTSFMMTMLVGTGDSDIKFDKAIIKNPQELGKTKKGKMEFKLLKKIFPGLTGEDLRAEEEDIPEIMPGMMPTNIIQPMMPMAPYGMQNY